MNPNRLKPFSLFLFSIFIDYIVFKQAITPTIFREYGRNGIVFFLLSLILLVLLFFLPKNFYKRMQEIKIVRILIGISAIVQIVMLITISINVIVNIFYYNQYRIIFMLVLLGVIIAISQLNLEQIVNLSASFFIFIPMLWLITYFFIPDLNLLELAYPNFKILQPILLLNVVLTSLFLFCQNDVKKTPIILGRVVGLSFLCIEYILILCISGEHFFNGYEYIGFISYQIQNPNRYIGSFDFISIISLVVCTVYLGSYLLRLTPICFKLKNKYRLLIAGVIFIVCAYLTAHLDIFSYVLDFLVLFQCVSLGISYLIMVGVGIERRIRNVPKE